MSIATYSDLQTAIGNWMARSNDTSITGNAVDFITLAEARLNRKLQLRLAKVDVSLVGVVGSTLITLPTDFAEAYTLDLTTYNVYSALPLFMPEDMQLSFVRGTPNGWAINGASLQLNCPCDVAHTFQFRYRQKFALSVSTPTNYLLTNYPDVYLAACLVWGGIFSKGSDQFQYWKQVLEEGLEEVQWLDTRADALAPLKTEVALQWSGRFNIYSGETI